LTLLSFAVERGEEAVVTTAVASRVVVAGPLAPFAPGFLEELERYRYKSSAQHAQMLVMARLSGWLAGEGLGASELNPMVLERFIAELGRRGYRNPRSLRGFGTLLGYLRRVGAVPVPAPPVPAPVTAEEELLDRYRRYLIGERGVCEQVARAYIGRVRRFLEWRARVGGARPEGLTGADVSAFVVSECPGRSTRWGRDLTLALRSFLVFLHVDGVLGGSLAAAVPRVAGWRLAGLPRPLDPGVAQQLVAGCDLGTVIGRRDRAILLLLWRLALRRGEVAAMMLDDLDWRAGELRVCGKSRRVEVLPLPWDIGQALAEYVRDDRPRVERRAVFVAVNAPHGPLTPATVSRVVADAARRAGVSGVTAHRLRHTAATEMLREGASLIEIGQVLRHRQTQTTAIYAKVDVETLRSVARAWPRAGS
jgi:integrase/recombinase XerD